MYIYIYVYIYIYMSLNTYIYKEVDKRLRDIMLRYVEFELSQLLTIRQNYVSSVITFCVDIVSARFSFCQTR